MVDLYSILETWKNVEIANRLGRFLASALGGWLPDGRSREPSSIGELRDDFFAERILYGDRVRLVGRLSQYCPLYFPVAYSPQLAAPTQTSTDTGSRVFSGWSLTPQANPTLTSTHARSSTGNTLAFLFEESATETPRLVSLYHPDRSSDNPFPRMVRGIPVIVDAEDETLLDDIVEVRARVSRLDARVSQAIEESRQPDVLGYYQDFYRREQYPNPGYVLDARHSAGGGVRLTQRFAPFFTSLGVEMAVDPSPDEREIENLAQAVMRDVAPGPVARYQPAFYTPGGYRVVQFGCEDASIHVAPSLGVISVAARIDVKGNISGVVAEQLLPLLARLKGGLQASPGLAPRLLYSSDARLAHAAWSE